ncbi:hypothetical protein Daus18300_000807 [Diaporthe australafricana]|uniref:Uncharacterized protein n=1 Tax=Diaporthe australafricana TaxID=127596 RepID=A0ABR3Y213_9PEZI
MGQLAQLQLSRRSEEDEYGDGCDDTLEGRISALEDILLNARAVDVDATASFLGPTDPQGVLLLNEAMHACCVILFDTRFRGVPFTALLIRGQVKIVADEISKVRSDSRVLYASVFPLFIAAVKLWTLRHATSFQRGYSISKACFSIAGISWLPYNISGRSEIINRASPGPIG